jgi:NADPH:quinone reductase-like Zn-dependent oxidoreductase
MSYPKTYRALRRSAAPYPLTLEFSTESLPETLRPKDVVLRIHAASLNYRDVAMLREGKCVSPFHPIPAPHLFQGQKPPTHKPHRYPIPVNECEIEGSCCAAEVTAVGAAVTKFAPGDHVVPTVHLNFLTGEERDADMRALGGNTAGVLREWAVCAEGELVRLPGHLSWEEVSDFRFQGLRGLVCVPERMGS